MSTKRNLQHRNDMPEPMLLLSLELSLQNQLDQTRGRIPIAQLTMQEELK